MSKDYYAVLGVARNATAAQIRQRFMELAREQHPDRYAGAEKARAEAAFQEITEAFNVLSSADRRRLHDFELSRPKGATEGGSEKELVKVYLSRGVKAYREGKFQEAAECFDRATKADPENGKAWHHLALACSQDERWIQRATVAIARACELEPMKVSYLKVAGKIHAAAGVVDKAIQYYRQAVQWGGDDSEISEALEILSSPGKGRSRLAGFFGKI